MSNETEWVLVPREPSEAMLSAAHYELADKPFSNNAERSARAYAAMLAAAPQPPAEAPPVGEAGTMSGTNGGFTMAVFKAADVPVGTKLYAAPPSAPVGVEGFRTAVEKARRVWMDENPCEDGHDHVTPFDQFLYGALAQQPAAVDEMGELVGLLDEVRSHFTRDDDLPDDLLPRIDAALAAQQGGAK